MVVAVVSAPAVLRKQLRIRVTDYGQRVQELTTKSREATQFRHVKARFDPNSLSAMRPHLVFQTLEPGMATDQKYLLRERGVLAYNAIINGI
jgi:hypothetical protein